MNYSYCKNCGKRFGHYPSETDRVYCSKECRAADQNEEVRCAGCGKVYLLYKSLTASSRGRNKNYCSNECYQNSKPKNVPFVCEECGITFEVWPSRAKRGNVRFCSKTCSKKWLGEYIKKVNPNLKIAKIEVTCETCGTKFMEVPSRIKANSRFCSNKCYGIWREQSGISSGDNNPRYRDGSTPRTHTRTRSAAWKRIADAIRAERGNECEVCGYDGKRRKLPVHHKIPWEVSHDDSPENLMVVCQPCHVTLDNAYFNSGVVPF